MNLDQLVFVGMNGYVVALDRDSGEIIWSNNNLKSGHVTMILDGDRLIVSTNGYIFCLDPLTGATLWNNEMRGYGFDTASLISVRGASSQTVVMHAAQDDDASSSSSSTTSS